jgi:hypothetical protein
LVKVTAEDLAARFWPKVQTSEVEDCWPWSGATNQDGYGVFHIGKRALTPVGNRAAGAHRMAWWLTHGDPGEKWVLHRCDNPPCCNPAHLYLGDHEQNIRDMVQRGRLVTIRGEKHANAKLNDERVRITRRWSEMGKSLYPLAKRWGVTPTILYRVARGEAWLHVVPEDA